jgi:hypothetical protein
MPKSRKNYHEGDVFTVPLPNGGYGLGVVARCGRLSVILGYFFGPAIKSLPDKGTFTLRGSDAVLIERVGNRSLRNNEWTVVGRVDNWDRDDFPNSYFVRPVGYDSKLVEIVQYDEETLLEVVDRKIVPSEQSILYYFDVLASYKAVESRLGDALRVSTSGV